MIFFVMLRLLRVHTLIINYKVSFKGHWINNSTSKGYTIYFVYLYILKKFSKVGITSICENKSERRQYKKIGISVSPYDLKLAKFNRRIIVPSVGQGAQFTRQSMHKWWTFSKQSLCLIVKGIPVGTSHQVVNSVGPLLPHSAKGRGWFSFRFNDVSFCNTFLDTLWNSHCYDLAHMGKNLKFFTAPFANLNLAQCSIKWKYYKSSSSIFSFTILFVFRQPRVRVRGLCELYII